MTANHNQEQKSTQDFDDDGLYSSEPEDSAKKQLLGGDDIAESSAFDIGDDAVQNVAV